MKRLERTSTSVIRWTTFMMFMMFAMTTDSVGIIIPQIVKEFRLSLAAASAFHYATMSAIAVAAMLAGFLADRIGRVRTILLGMILFVLNSYLFIVGQSFGFFLCLLSISGAAIGIYKTGALALVGDISASIAEHTSTMNLIEGFFGVGAIIGPLLVTILIAGGASWKWLYGIAGTLGVVLILLALLVRYPHTGQPRVSQSRHSRADLRRSIKMTHNRYALAFAMGAFLYVAAEASVYVFGPTYFGQYHGSLLPLATYGVTVFFTLRAVGRFLGAWLLGKLGWSQVMAVSSLAIFLCFSGSVLWGCHAAVLLLPASGLFMSVIYPTLTSKGISCFRKTEHGAVSGLILLFTCAGAALGPFCVGLVADACGDVRYGFALASGFAAALCAGLIYNWLRQPTRMRLADLDQIEYGAASRGVG